MATKREQARAERHEQRERLRAQADRLNALHDEILELADLDWSDVVREGFIYQIEAMDMLPDMADLIRVIRFASNPALDRWQRRAQAEVIGIEPAA